jgi:DNA primase
MAGKRKPRAPDIVSVIGDYLPLHPHGRGYTVYVASCPFHDTGDGEWPTFIVDRSRDCFRCGVCEATGDAADFVAVYEKIDRAAALAMLAERRIRVP